MKKAGVRGIAISFCFMVFGGLAFAQSNPWSDVSKASVSVGGRRDIVPNVYRVLRLDLPALWERIRQAPLEFTEAARQNPVTLELPLPGGGFARFNIQDSPIMEPGLAVRYPEIRTFSGNSVNRDAWSVRLDITPQGLHAMMFTPSGIVFIDPYSNATTQFYICYYKQDLAFNESKRFSEEPVVDELGMAEQMKQLVAQNVMTPTGPTLRTYRLACAATGEYTVFHGGTKALGQAAIVTAMNRVNGVYEKEVAVRMTLVANNDTLVFTSSGSDPYTNSDGFAMLGQNQTTVTNRIGSANYDIGHVFSTGGGGVAGLGVVCVSSQKARGVTGSGSPTGDAFWIDYVAHEIGHQFGGNHTFNSTASNCGGGNRNGSTAYEPGSGSTIMAYAGICGADDLQPNSDAIFHTISFDEIVAFTNSGGGNGCAVLTSTGNSAPVVNAGTGGFTIPISTPFTLTGSATDADALTYCWEEFDLGPSGSPNSPSGNAPIFRTFNPVSSPSRTFPKQSNLLNNTQTIGEILPTYTRTLAFRLTVRDNKVGGGGVDRAGISFSVTSTAGPFLVTSPNTAVTWGSGTNQTVTWNVANTSASPVSCSSVNIRLSTDGGVTFPTLLASGVTNDGSEVVVLPIVTSSTARIKVEAVGNIFFDLSNTNFTIANMAPSTPALVSPADNVTGQLDSVMIKWRVSSGATSYKLQVGTDSTFAGGIIVNDSTLTDTSRAVTGLTFSTKHFWRVAAKSAGGTSAWSSLRRFTTLAAPAAPALLSPADGVLGQPFSLSLLWQTSASAASYTVEVGTDSAFAGGIIFSDSTFTDTTASLSGLSIGTKYFWRVRGKNVAGVGTWAGPWDFTTLAPPVASSLLSPADSATDQTLSPVFVWSTAAFADLYTFELSTDSGFGTLVESDSTLTDSTKSVSGLLAATPYFWRVNGRNTAGTGAWSTPSMFTTIAPPAAATLISPADGATSQPVNVDLTWNPSSLAAGYILQVSTDSTFAGGLVVDDSTVTDTVYAVSGLLATTEYFWRVQSLNEAGSSAWSSVWKFTTVSAPAMVNLVAPPQDTELSVDSTILVWESTLLVEKYWVEWSDDSLFAISSVDSTVTDTTLALADLQDSTTYFWRVRPGNTAGWGAFSETRRFETFFQVQVCAPLQPRWTIVSVPVGVQNDSSHVLFPACGGETCPFSFVPGSGYEENCNLERGVGYWVKCTAGSVCFTGTIIASDTIEVEEGWNLIGSVTAPVQIENIVTVPSGIIASPFYRFEDGYLVSTAIDPGIGYWVKASQAGVIILNGSSAPARAQAVPNN